MDKSPPVNWKAAAIDELTKGRDLAVRLGTILEAAAGHPKNKELLVGISDSFSRALIILGSGVKLENDMMNEEKNEKTFSEKKRKNRSGRGGYRQRGQPYSCTRTTAKTLEDGHSWRKYGQKAIFESKFPRGYYRCSHKHDQKCVATRQVQQSEQDPSLYIITYIGEHTCQNFNEILTSLENKEPCIIDFGSNAASPRSQDHKSPFLPISDEEVVSNGYLVEGSGQLVVEELMSDVTSCSPDSVVDGLGWDFMESFEFSDMFDFDQGGTFFLT